MYWFGEIKSQDFQWMDSSLWNGLNSKKKEFARTSLNDILDVLDAFGQESFDDALPGLLAESGFSEEETLKTLRLLPTLLKRENLEKRLRAEFTNTNILDQFAKLPHGTHKVRAVPKGILLHVTAGNVFLSSIDSLIMGLVTKNLSVVKVSSQNRYFPMYFAEKLSRFDQGKILSDKFAILHWKGGDERAESFVKNHVNAILAWGGEEMISSYQTNLPREVKLLDFGPKISIQVITQKGLENKNLDIVAEKIVADITPWDQSACASPQNLYLEEGSDEKVLLEALNKAFLKAPPRGLIDEDEATEILKEKYRALYSELMEGGTLLEGSEHLIHLEQNNSLRPSPLHRSLFIKRFKGSSDLSSHLEPFSYYLQSCSYLLGSEEKASFLNDLSLTGIKRFAPLGTVTWGMEGAPHDGRLVLRELVTFIGDEERIQDYGEKTLETTDSNVLRSFFQESKHPAGYIFSSGGTTGEPKFLHMSYEEFDYMSDMLAMNLKLQGVKRGMTVANLFVAGNLWSSFLCVEKALEKIGVVQLPIGGMCSPENILLYLKKFTPDIVMGIPSMLVMTAEYMVSKNESLNIPMVFYAGEALSQARIDFLKKTWGTEVFGSAGYASVDAGVIGYQCSHCGPGEHHVFSDLIKLDIYEGEGIVSSLARNSMPVKNYRTGDRIDWISDCSCGSRDRRFKLLGRVDDVIQIWSCRMLLSDIEKVLGERGILTYQLMLKEVLVDDKPKEKMDLYFEAHNEVLDQDELLLALYNRSRDVRDTIDFTSFRANLELIPVGSIDRNARTGKISTVKDLRR